MSNDLVQELNKKTKSKKFLKMEAVWYDSGEMYIACGKYKTEGVNSKLAFWRVTPSEFLALGKTFTSELKPLFDSYVDEPTQSDKLIKVAKYVLEISDDMTIDHDLVTYEEFGSKGRLKPTRLGLQLWKKNLESSIGEAAKDLYPFIDKG